MIIRSAIQVSHSLPMNHLECEEIEEENSFVCCLLIHWRHFFQDEIHRDGDRRASTSSHSFLLNLD